MDNPFCGTSASLAEAGHSNEEATCRHQTSHDLALIDPGLFPGQARSAARGVRHQPKSLFGISRNQRSTSSEIGVRLAPKWPFGFARPTQQGGSASPLLANLYLHYAFDLWVQQWRKKT